MKKITFSGFKKYIRLKMHIKIIKIYKIKDKTKPKFKIRDLVIIEFDIAKNNLGRWEER